MIHLQLTITGLNIFPTGSESEQAFVEQSYLGSYS